MSATVDRLNEMERATAPMPWPVEFFYLMPDDAFALVFGLQQAWPLLREEIVSLEAAVVSLSRENAQLHSEHSRLVAASTALGVDLAACRERAAREAAEAAEHTRIIEAENDALNAKLAKLPMRTLAAEAVCKSIDPHHKGSGGAWAFYDGEAHDAWKKADS